MPEPQPILDTKFEVRTETSIRTATSKSIVMQSNNALFAKRNGLLFNNNTTKDSNIDNNSESKSKSLVILRGFCRKAPMESENPHCFRAEALYFYNVTSASCEAFYKGHCARSRNKFNSVQECQDKCIIKNNSKSSLSSISNPISKSKIIFDRPLGTAATTTTTGTTKRPLQLFKRPRTLFNRRRTAPAAKRLFWDCFLFQFPYIPQPSIHIPFWWYPDIYLDIFNTNFFHKISYYYFWILHAHEWWWYKVLFWWSHFFPINTIVILKCVLFLIVCLESSSYNWQNLRNTNPGTPQSGSVL